MRHSFLSLIIFALALPIAAQDGLEINKVFKGEIVSEKAMKESLVKGDNLAPYKLRVLHTAKFTVGDSRRDEVEALFEEDMKGRLSEDDENIELEYRDGHLYYAIEQEGTAPIHLLSMPADHGGQRHHPRLYGRESQPRRPQENVQKEIT